LGVNHEGSEADADFASDDANLPRAYFVAGKFDKADHLCSRAVTIFKAAIAALPAFRDNHSSRLRSTLLEYAKPKTAKGDTAGAAQLESEAAAIGNQVPRRQTPPYGPYGWHVKNVDEN